MIRLKKEKISLPCGTFECYVINLAVYSGVDKLLRHYLWVAVTEYQYLVKYDSGTAMMELMSIGNRKKGEPVKIRTHPQVCISLTAPAGWNHCWAPSVSMYKFMLHLLPPELKAWALLAAAEVPSAITSARQLAKGDIAVLKMFFKG